MQNLGDVVRHPWGVAVSAFVVVAMHLPQSLAWRYGTVLTPLDHNKIGGEL